MSFIGLLTAFCIAQTDEPLIHTLSARSHPPNLALVGTRNPWGERLIYRSERPEGFPSRVVAAASVYASQNIRFDGYFGSDDDGKHYLTAADGEDNAYFGNQSEQSYYVRRDGVADDLGERVWVCLDLPVHSLALAGFPIREAMAIDFQRFEDVYTFGGTFEINHPGHPWFYRRIRNLQLYFEHQQRFSEQRITKEQYRDPNFRPTEPFSPGDIAFLGHYGDLDGKEGWWRPQHSAVVATVDERGLPVKLYNMRVSKDLVDNYHGEINQTRPIGDKQVFFKRFSDRYSLIGFGRIVNWRRDAVDEEPEKNAPRLELIEPGSDSAN